EVFGNDLAAGVDKEILRDTLYAVLFGHGIIPKLQIADVCPGEIVFVDRIEPFILLTRPVEGNAEYGKGFGTEFLEVRHHIRILMPAGAAPARPEIEQNIFTTK